LNPSTGIADGEQLRDFVKRFTGGIVARGAEAAVYESLRLMVSVRGARQHVIEQCVPAGHDQADSRQSRSVPGMVRLEEDRVDVAFEVVHRNQRLAEFEREHLSVGHSHEERPDQAWALCDPNCIEVAKR
jgi:hypothetical protein